MGSLSRFDIAEHPGVAMVVVESDLLLPDPAVVVIPLLLDYPAVRYLNPGDPPRWPAPRSRDAPHRRRPPIPAAEDRERAEQGDEITRAVDVLMGVV